MTDSQGQHCPNCEAQAAEIEYWKTEARNVRRELKSEQKQADSAMDNYDAIHRRCEAQAAEIEKLREALTQIARLRTDLRGDFSLGSKQSDIARAALGETK